MKRGDVVLVRFPHPSGLRGKKRPAVVAQSDAYAGVLKTVIVAEVTSNQTMAADPACLLIDTTTPEGRATGVVRDCIVSCLVLVTVYADTVVQVLGTLSPSMKQRLDDCLKAANRLPRSETNLERRLYFRSPGAVSEFCAVAYVPRKRLTTLFLVTLFLVSLMRFFPIWA